MIRGGASDAIRRCPSTRRWRRRTPSAPHAIREAPPTECKISIHRSSSSDANLHRSSEGAKPEPRQNHASTRPASGQRQDTTALDADAGRAVRGRDGVREGDGVRGKGRSGPGVMGDTPGPVQSPTDVSHEDASPMRSRGHRNGERRGSDVGRSRLGGTI